MTTSESGVGRTEPLGLTQAPAIPVTVADNPISAMASQLERLTATVNKWESRFEANERHAGDMGVSQRPPPAPPFSQNFMPQLSCPLPLYSTVTTTMPPLLQHQHTSGLTLGAQFTNPLSAHPFMGPFEQQQQTLGMPFTQHALYAAAMPYSLPTYGVPEGVLQQPSSLRPSQQFAQQWQPDRSAAVVSDCVPLQRPQMVSPSSCWGPPNIWPQFGVFGQEQQQHRVKMEPPRFDGSEVNNWIRGIQYYFDHVGTPDAHRLHYVIMLFDPSVADWIWNYCSSHEQVTWYEFLDDVRRRFDPHCYTSHVGLLKKLTQTGTVSDYQLAFEKLQNNTVGVPDHVLLDLYVAGLRQPIQDEVLLHRPATLAAAFALAIRIASCRPELNQAAGGLPRRQWQPRDNRQSSTAALPGSTGQASPAPPARGQGAPNRSSDISKLPIIRLSAAEKADRARRGLCYYCDEKWVSGHVCKHRFLAYMGADDDDEDDFDTGSEGIPTEVIAADLSHLHTMDGTRRSKSLTMTGTIGTAPVTVLIDIGSSHDFLHPRIAEQLRLPLTAVKPFRVYVGNGESLLCSHMSKNTQLIMQGTSFSIDLHILPVHGPDVILGMEWLESLGRVTTDYVAKSMEFTRGNDVITLSGMPRRPRKISLNSLASIVTRASLFELYELVQMEPGGESAQTATSLDFPKGLPDVISVVLRSHAAVFQLPEGLPPIRQFDHRIYLLPNAKPVNVRPYRYPYFQKNEIEKQVKEMLDQGVIQRSHSPFSSPVLLVRKKDGTFRFCIDYRALNKATVPDHFPIPTADELFDELGAARFFY